MTMPLHPGWEDISLRLLLTLLAAAAIGFNRGVRGHAAGLRTTILVGLAAATAMIQANILLSLGGKAADSFGVMDLMRLPLGILTGVGFIGGGAILRRGDMVTGITTAATLWVVTVIGLCLGGGQLALGIAATALVVLVLWGLKWFDLHMSREHRALLVIAIDAQPAALPDIDRLLEPLGYRARFHALDRADGAQRWRQTFEIRWKQREIAGPPSALIDLLEKHYTVEKFEWTAESG
jgi:putative Mg2+ transporter-C (MgtC) family protein